MCHVRAYACSQQQACRALCCDQKPLLYFQFQRFLHPFKTCTLLLALVTHSVVLSLVFVCLYGYNLLCHTQTTCINLSLTGTRRFRSLEDAIQLWHRRFGYGGHNAVLVATDACLLSPSATMLAPVVLTSLHTHTHAARTPPCTKDLLLHNSRLYLLNVAASFIINMFYIGLRIIPKQKLEIRFQSSLSCFLNNISYYRIL